jgi:hypothetical protein
MGDSAVSEPAGKTAATWKPGIFVSVFLLFAGFPPLMNFIGSPRFQTIRTVDVLALMASGGCIGAALATFAIFRRGLRSR